MKHAAEIALFALLLRWVYDVALFVTMGDAGLVGPDSALYLNSARTFAESLGAGTVHGWDWLGPNPMLMPLFSWVMTGHVLIFGGAAPLSYVMMQGVLDAGTCIVAGRLAGAFSPRFAIPAALAAAVNPTQIVLSGLVYTDAPFAFFVAMSFLTTALWLEQRRWLWAVLLGLCFAAAISCRVLFAPWAALHLGVLLLVCLYRRIGPRAILQLAVAGAIFGGAVAPVVLRNAIQYGALALTPQSGSHLALYVVPFVTEAKDGTVWAKSYERMQILRDARFGAQSANPFEESRRYAIIGREALAELGLGAVVKAWAVGAAINFASPAILISPPVFTMPRTGFAATPGKTTLEKIRKYLFQSDNRLYGWIALLGIAGVILIRLVQLGGAIALVAAGRHRVVLVLLALWTGYILLLNGPIASPKYRLPIEPVLVILTGAGLASLRRRSPSPVNSDRRSPDTSDR